MFGRSTQEAKRIECKRMECVGKCPKCGDVVKGKFGAYCKDKCGMNVSWAMGAALIDSQIKSMLEEKDPYKRFEREERQL